jgi:hypothetical protein
MTLRELRLRYADLKGGKVVCVEGTLSANDYYNCRFGSPARWRGFRLSGGDVFGDTVSVYCPKGEAKCEALYDSVVSLGAFAGTALVAYPSSNRVCEADQANLIGFRFGE